ncbi:MAG: hypothetical protein ACYC8S_03540 [Minisyncoccota bacterium]
MENSTEEMRVDDEGWPYLVNEDGVRLPLSPPKILGPGEMIERARQCQIEKLESSILFLSELVPLLQARVKEANDEIKEYRQVVKTLTEEMREKDRALFGIGQQNALLHKDSLHLEQRVTKAEALLEKMKTAISEAQLCWKRAKSLKRPKIKDLQRELTEIHRLLSKLDLESDPLPK